MGAPSCTGSCPFRAGPTRAATTTSPSPADAAVKGVDHICCAMLRQCYVFVPCPPRPGPTRAQPPRGVHHCLLAWFNAINSTMLSRVAPLCLVPALRCPPPAQVERKQPPRGVHRRGAGGVARGAAGRAPRPPLCGAHARAHHGLRPQGALRCAGSFNALPCRSCPKACAARRYPVSCIACACMLQRRWRRRLG